MLQKEFPLKLRNVYSFFTIYANIDGFDPAAMHGRPAAERTLLDRWILSELALLTLRVTELMDGYRAYEAAGQLSAFVDGLSNWYLRRSRHRYWKSEFDADKEDAYATLYEALVTSVKLAAPFVPFMAEEIYLNLVTRPFGKLEPESVHLCDHPQAEESHIDPALSDEMAMVRNIVSLGLRVRTDHRLKVRQPLSEAEVVLPDPEQRETLRPYGQLIADELNVHQVEFVRGGTEHVRYVCTPELPTAGAATGQEDAVSEASVRLRRCSRPYETTCCRRERQRLISTVTNSFSSRMMSRLLSSLSDTTPPPATARPWLSSTPS